MIDEKFEELNKKREDIKKQLEMKLEANEITQEIYDELMDFSFDFKLINLSCTDKFKKCFELKKEIKCSELVLEIYEEHKENFRKAFLISDCILDPLSYNFSKDKYDLTIRILLRSYNLAQKSNCDEKLLDEIIQILTTIRILYENNSRNSKMLVSSKFGNLSLSQQVRMLCIFLQDQSRLMYENLMNEAQKMNYCTGLEMAVANQKVNYCEDIQISLTDNYEAHLEYFDTLIRYLYFIKKKDLKGIKLIDDEIFPYNLPSFEEIVNIAMLRVVQTDIWSKFKYLEWQMEIRKTIDDIDVYIYSPRNKELYQQHIIAGLRRGYQDTYTIYQQPNNLWRNSLKSVESIIKHVDFFDPDSIFNIEKGMFNKAKGIGKTKVDIFRKNVKSFYLKCKINDIGVEIILFGFEYLFTLATIFNQVIKERFDQENQELYPYLVPVIDKDKFVEHFSNLYNIDRDVSNKIIDFFIFNERLKSEGDIFTKPLIHIGNDKLLFCETLINQMNIERSIEMLFGEHHVDLAPMGFEFEKKLRSILSLVPFLSVNTKKVEFLAFDGRNVEFDFIGTFYDRLFIIEFKDMTVPYDDKELYSCESNIKYGVDQVNRRCKVIQHDWEKIKSLCNVELPNDPVAEEKIIKIVCTNINNFTTLEYDGVRITDESTLLKFFINPEVGVYSNKGGENNTISKKGIWKNRYPTVDEFIQYLGNPVTVDYIKNCLKDEIKLFPSFPEDHPVAIIDQVLSEDPVKRVVANIPHIGKTYESKPAKKHKKKKKRKK